MKRQSTTAASGWVLRVLATAHLVAGFAQPVFAGVYLSGDFDGLSWHALGADVLSYVSYAQLIAAIVVWVRVGRAWPFVLTLLLVAAETVQILAGFDGALWLHVPLGVLTVAGIVVVFIAVWLRPLPCRRRTGPAQGRSADTADARDAVAANG